ncbi:MAG TPA: hypothetical protein VLM80_13385, partial [Anaerolineales bacterium]|nr:hypothetical protein [Anaerolineales bacterium]
MGQSYQFSLFGFIQIDYVFLRHRQLLPGFWRIVNYQNFFDEVLGQRVICDKLAPIMNANRTQRIVIKLGTSTLTAGTTQLSLPRMVELVRQMAQLHAAGSEVVLVTSGAIAAGRERLSFRQLPKDIPAKQMLAAVGQPRLMAIYEQLFGLYGLTVAQVLLTRSDLADRRR